jgi:two-component sensor histidine kinase
MISDHQTLLLEKLHLFESHLQYAWVKWTGGEAIEILSKSSGLPFFVAGATYDLPTIIHRMDKKRVQEHYDQLGATVSKIQFTVYQPKEDNLKMLCSSTKTDDFVLSLWILLPDESKSLGLLAIAAHDLRSPVSSVIGLVNLIQMMMMDGDIPVEELSNLMEMIKTSSNKALQLTDEILELADMESDGYVLNTQPVVMREYVERYIKSHGAFKLKKRIEIVLESHTDAVVLLNEGKITRVLDNLISNAAKFSYPDSQIEIIVEESANQVIVKVRDHGVGMPQEMIDEIFVKFGRAQRPGLEGEDSHGLGMSIVKQIMTLHGGNITVESQERIGTTMNLFFKKA